MSVARRNLKEADAPNSDSTNRNRIQGPRRRVTRQWTGTAIDSSPWIEQGERYLQALLDCRDDADRENLARQMPDIHAAYTLYRSKNKLRHGRLEGHLLTTCPFEDVATACKLSAATVEIYEHLFFSVRNRLNRAMHIRSVAFDGKFWDDLTDNDTDLFLKKAGLQGGVATLEPMFRYLSNGLRFPESAPLTHRQLVELREMVTMRGLILTWILPASQIVRACILSEFIDELKVLITLWPETDAPPTSFPIGIPVERFELWWALRQKDIIQAAEKRPNKMRQLKETARKVLSDIPFNEPGS